MKKIVFDFTTVILSFLFLLCLVLIFILLSLSYIGISDYDAIEIKEDFKLVFYFSVFFIVIALINLEVSKQARFCFTAILLCAFLFFISNLSSMNFLSSRRICLNDGVCAEGVYIWNEKGDKIEFSSKNCHGGNWNKDRKACILHKK